MLERLADLEKEYDDVLRRLSDPDVIADQRALREESKRHKQLEPIVQRYREYRAAIDQLAEAKEMLASSSGDDREVWRSLADESEATIARLEEELRVLLLPHDPNDDKNVIVEIRGAEGGEEANLFARDLFDMYTRYADRHGWKVDVMNSDESDRGGFNEVTFMLKGDGVWSRMKHEGGPHRVQRVPHLPTGVVVAMQDEKSQIQNRAKAMQVLRSRLLKMEQDRQAAELSDQRRSQVGGGGRSEKIRTYNYKENRVTDHRIGMTTHTLDKGLAGELE